jgi:hypothetical protein
MGMPAGCDKSPGFEPGGGVVALRLVDGGHAWPGGAEPR